MPNQKNGDLTGYSESGLEEAIENALEQAGDAVRVEVVETRGILTEGENNQYQVTLATFDE